MEGRAIARPDSRRSGPRSSRCRPSMEGRAIARPDVPVNVPPIDGESSLQWRAGQLPGLTRVSMMLSVASQLLQWRAGQLPGLTGLGHLRHIPEASPSMEGRAIARPDDRMEPMSCVNCSGLQWRAGQLPGLTRGRIVNVPSKPSPSMEGRAIARPDERPEDPHPFGLYPSMEGRAIARPDLLRHPCRRGLSRRLQWRAGQLPGLTARLI